MPITIVNLAKPFAVACGGSQILVTPLSKEQDDEIRARHTPAPAEGESPELDDNGYIRELTETVVTGWTGVLDQAGEPWPFSKELVWSLPIDVLKRVWRCLRGLEDPLAERSGAISTPSGEEPSGKRPTEG